MRSLLSALLLVLGLAGAAFAQNIVRIEYFFDTDPGFGNGIPVSFNPAINVTDVNFTANTSGLTSGFHIFQVRSQDANGRWSIVNSAMVYKPEAALGNTLHNIVRLEYFFGIDPGFGNGTAVAITPNTNLADVNFSANTSVLTSGFHIFQVRSQDANGRWSIINSAAVYKPEVQTTVLPNVVRIEYFIDTDPGFGNATPTVFTPNTNIADLSTAVDIAGLANGGHYFFMRSLDANGRYSSTSSKYFEVNNTVLPLTLLNYNASLENTGVKNYWTTANETNTLHFVVERSLNAVDFKEVGRISAKNIAGQHNYFFNDKLAASLAGQTLYYRLKQVDINQKFSYSEIVPVKLGVVKQLTVSPNPASDVITVFAPKAKSVSLMSIIGSVVYSSNLNQAWDSTVINVSQFQRGTYLVKVVGEDNKILTEKVILR